MNQQDIQLLYEYNRWANAQVLKASSTLTEEQFTEDLSSSHRSVRATLTHMLAVEWLWLMRWKGEAWQYPLWQMMQHVVNHSSYHRGQVATLLRQLGAEPAPTDFLLFFDVMSPTKSLKPTAR